MLGNMVPTADLTIIKILVTMSVRSMGLATSTRLKQGGKTQGEGEDLQVTQLLARDQTRLEEMDKMSKEICHSEIKRIRV